MTDELDWCIHDPNRPWIGFSDGTCMCPCDACVVREPTYRRCACSLCECEGEGRGTCMKTMRRDMADGAWVAFYCRLTGGHEGDCDFRGYSVE